MKELEIKVVPHSDSMKFYCFYYRFKKKFNLFNSFKQLVEVYDGANLSYDQPVMYSNFEDAVEYAKKLKENPALIDEHYKKQDEIYQQALKRKENYRKERDKSIII